MILILGLDNRMAPHMGMNTGRQGLMATNDNVICGTIKITVFGTRVTGGQLKQLNRSPMSNQLSFISQFKDECQTIYGTQDQEKYDRKQNQVFSNFVPQGTDSFNFNVYSVQEPEQVMTI